MPVAASNTARLTFTDIQRHLRDSGGALGTILADDAGELQELFSPAVRQGLQTGAETAGRAAEELGRMAEGVLTGIARGLDQATRHPPRESGPEKGGDG